jgi:hypothetical protein
MFGLPSDLLPSRFTTKVAVNVYLSTLPSRFISNSSTDLQFLVTLCNEAQNNEECNSTVLDIISSNNNCNFTLTDTCRKPRDMFRCSASTLHVSRLFFLKPRTHRDKKMCIEYELKFIMEYYPWDTKGKIVRISQHI